MILKPHIIYSLTVILSVHFCFAQNRTVEITHYIFPEFIEGSVLMKTGKKNTVNINYNALSEEMVFTKGDLKLAIGSTESEMIDTIFVQDERRFVRLNGKFVEVLYQSSMNHLFVQYKCRLKPPGKSVGYGGTSETSAVDNYSVVQGDSRFYELELPDGYTTSPYIIYLVKINGVVHEAASIKRLEKLYSDKKSEFRSYVKENKIKYDDIDGVVGLVQYIESKN